MSSAETVVGLLRQRGLTIAVAESLTGGDLTSALVSVPGASEVLRGGIVAYATAVKQSLLDVDAALLRRHGAVHADVARQMAQGVRAALAIDGLPADVGVSTTGVAGPDPQDGQPVGTVHIAVVTASQTRIRSFDFIGDRVRIRRQATEAALDLVRQTMDGGE